MRQLSDLIDKSDPGIVLIREWAAGSDAVEILPPDEALRSEALLRLQVTTRSILGAVVYETGGILANNGRLRLLGSGNERSLAAANDAVGGMRGGPDDVLIVADDVLGGVFALNGGRFGQDNLGQIFYLAADDLVWTCLDVGYSDFVSWCLGGDLDMLYGRFADFPAYQKTPPVIGKAFSFVPFLWTEEGREGKPNVKPIDADEVLRLHLEIAGYTVD